MLLCVAILVRSIVFVMKEVLPFPQAADDCQRQCKWTKEEDELLCIAVQTHDSGNWHQVSTHVPGRSPIQCLHRWTKLHSTSHTATWSAQEDQQLRAWVQAKGPAKWVQCALNLPGRSGKQCRERWIHTLNPNGKIGNWTQEEDQILLKEFERVGAKWTEIVQALPGRTESSVKTRFYSSVCKLRPKSSVSVAERCGFDSIGATEPGRRETAMQVLTLLRCMQKLEGMLSYTREEIIGLEDAILM